MIRSIDTIAKDELVARVVVRVDVVRTIEVDVVLRASLRLILRPITLTPHVALTGVLVTQRCMYEKNFDIRIMLIIRELTKALITTLRRAHQGSKLEQTRLGQTRFKTNQCQHGLGQNCLAWAKIVWPGPKLFGLGQNSFAACGLKRKHGGLKRKHGVRYTKIIGEHTSERDSGVGAAPKVSHTRVCQQQPSLLLHDQAVLGACLARADPLRTGAATWHAPHHPSRAVRKPRGVVFVCVCECFQISSSVC